LYVLTQEALREEPTITQLAFARLLAWLDDGVPSHGERYLEMRRRLVSYFVEYYADVRRQKIERRRELAARLGISMNALGIRAFRIRDSLMACVEGCRQGRRQI
jgi:hypothetical protein